MYAFAACVEMFSTQLVGWHAAVVLRSVVSMVSTVKLYACVTRKKPLRIMDVDEMRCG